MKPRTDHEDAIQGALLEVTSAMSALNMHPEPLAEPQGEYLSESDRWAAHAYEHLHAVLELLNRAYLERISLRRNGGAP